MTPRMESLVAALADLSSADRAEVLRAFVVDVEDLRLLQEHESIVSAVERERYAGRLS